MRRRRWSEWLCRIAGLLWTLGWAAALYLVASPWRELGGWITERTRWFGWFVLYSGLVLGFALGDFVRDTRPPEMRPAYACLLRRVLYLPAVLTAAWLVVLQTLGQHDAAGVVFTAFLSFWAGIDVSLGALPLLEGRSSTNEVASGAASNRAGPTPPWES